MTGAAGLHLDAAILRSVTGNKEENRTWKVEESNRKAGDEDKETKGYRGRDEHPMTG